MTDKELDKLFNELTDGQKSHLGVLIDKYFIENDVKEYLEDNDIEYDEDDLEEIVDDVNDNYGYSDYIKPCVNKHFG